MVVFRKLEQVVVSKRGIPDLEKDVIYDRFIEAPSVMKRRQWGGKLEGLCPYA